MDDSSDPTSDTAYSEAGLDGAVTGEDRSVLLTVSVPTSLHEGGVGIEGMITAEDARDSSPEDLSEWTLASTTVMLEAMLSDTREDEVPKLTQSRYCPRNGSPARRSVSNN